MTKSYKSYFSDAVQRVRDEGRYRIFRDIRRKKGEFPKAERVIFRGQLAITCNSNQNWLSFIRKTRLSFLPLAMLLMKLRSVS